MPDERTVYGCVGADRPEACLFIDEVNGLLCYVYPECRLTAEGMRLLSVG
jgi:hypothetical protein